MKMKNLLGYACSILLLTSCNNADINEVAAPNNPLQFSTYIGKRLTKATEFNNASWTEGNKFMLHSYMQVGDSWTTFFNDNLVLSGGAFALEGSQRFNVPYPTKYIAIYPDQDTYEDTAVDFNSKYPQFSYTVDGSTDLLAAVQGHEALETDIQIPFHHLLSQINFGVYEYPGIKITISDIRIEGINCQGTFHLSQSSTAPGYWEQTNPVLQNYTYTYGSSNNFTTEGTSDTNGYIFGDGGTFAPDNSGIAFKYVFNDGIAYTKEDPNKPTSGLSNSLMLLPQSLEQLETNNATIYFKYLITDLQNNPIGKSTMQDGIIRMADLQIEWEPNYRYIYMLQFNTDNDLLKFNVNVSSFENE